MSLGVGPAGSDPLSLADLCGVRPLRSDDRPFRGSLATGDVSVPASGGVRPLGSDPSALA
jgi:hypothetical protein